jgi:hypothetical protein
LPFFLTLKLASANFFTKISSFASFVASQMVGEGKSDELALVAYYDFVEKARDENIIEYVMTGLSNYYDYDE